MHPLQRKNVLLADLKHRRIDMAEFMGQLAMWTAEEVDIYKYTPLPRQPKEVTDFESIPENVRRSIDPQYYKDHPQIYAYHCAKKAALTANQSLFDWLKESLPYLHNEEMRIKILNKMGEMPKEKEDAKCE